MVSEGWVSGWNRRTWNPLRRQRLRGFESLSLRHKSTYTKIFNKCPEITKSGVVVKVIFTLLIICFLEGVYYFINKLLFNRTFKQINLWEWIIVILIIPSIFAYLYYKQSNQVPWKTVAWIGLQHRGQESQENANVQNMVEDRFVFHCRSRLVWSS